MIRGIIFLILFVLSFGMIKSQTLELFDLDYSEYPKISAKFFAKDSKGMIISKLTKDDFRVTENSNIRNIIDVSCPEPRPLKPLSSVLVLDVSGSMGTNRMNMAKDGAIVWVEELNTDISECALTSFDHRNFYNCSFTQSKSTLITAINKLGSFPFGWTDYNKALIDPPSGALEIIKSKSRKKVIVFLSDGKPTVEPRTDDIITMAVQWGVTIHCISFYMRAPESMEKIARLTGGMLIDRVYDAEQLRKAYRKILDKEQGVQYCTITWESQPHCGKIHAELECIQNGAKSILDYQTPSNKLPSLSIGTNLVIFDNIKINNPVYKNNNISGIFGKIQVKSIKSDNPNFSCNYTGEINDGSTKSLLISYTAKDSSYEVAKFTIETNYCSFEFYAKAGNPNYIPPKPKLTLLHPNGGEKFNVGYDTVITWMGVAPTDTVSLDYSIDAGSNWINITNEATNLKYDWKNIPNTPSDRCLMKVKFKEFPLDNYSLKGGATVPFDDFIKDTATSSFTIEAWIYYRGGNFTIVNNNFGIVRKGLTSKEIWITGCFDDFILPTFVTLVPDTWYHFALTVDRSGQQPKQIVYIDGVKVIEANARQRHFIIDGYGTISFGTGNIDELKIWSIIRLPSDINEYLNKPMPMPQLGLMAYYDFDQNNQKLVDLSGFKRNSINNIRRDKISPFVKMSAVQSDISDNLWRIVKSNLISKDVDMKSCEVGKFKDSLVTVYLQNNGGAAIRIDSINFAGNHPDEFELVSDFDSFELFPFKSYDIEFRFKPKFSGGRNAKVKIYTNEGIYEQNIKGNGDKYDIEISSTFIDFGAVKLGDFKDSTITAAVTNKGNVNITFTKSYYIDINGLDYSTITGSGGFTLKPDESREITIRFTPSQGGKISGLLAFEYSAPGSPVFLELIGEGIDKNVGIEAADLTFEPLICKNSAIDSILIFSTGLDDLIISNYNLTGNKFEILNKLQNVTVKSGNNYTVYIKYYNNKYGSDNEILTLINNSDISPEYNINLTANRLNTDFTLSQDKINLGTICPEKETIINISLQNTGDLENSYSFELPPNVTHNYDGRLLKPVEISEISFTHYGNLQDGNFNDIIKIRDSICQTEKQILITGNVENSNLRFISDTLKCAYGLSVIGKIELINETSRDIIIEELPVINSNELEFVNYTLPIIVKAKSNEFIDLKYTPNDENNDAFPLDFNFNPCDNSLITTVYGITSVAEAMVSVGNYSGYSGENIPVEIKVTNSKNLDKSGITNIKGTLIFNSTMLLPSDISKSNEIDGNRFLPFTIPVVNGVTQPLTINFTAGLGNDSITTIELSGLKFEGGFAIINKQDGEFLLKGICYEGGARLLNPVGIMQINSVNPEPINNIMNLNFELRESEITTIEIISPNGQSRKLLEKYLEKGNYYMQFNLSEYSTGLFFLRLMTNNETIGRKIIIIN